MPTYSGTAISGTVNGYCSRTNLRSAPALNFEATYTSDDVLLDSIITAVSREIDRHTGRYFYKSASAETAYFTAQDSDFVDVGDLVSITSLATDDGSRTYPDVWASTDYDLWPFNVASFSEDEPYRQIHITPEGDFTFPRNTKKGVKVVGIFGWNAVPVLIQQAALLWSERTYKRLSTPLGSSSMSALGVVTVKVPAPDPDIQMMLETYRRIL